MVKILRKAGVQFLDVKPVRYSVRKHIKMLDLPR